MAVLEVIHATKRYKARGQSQFLLRGGGVKRWLRRQPREIITALDDITFTVEPGESVGIIGRNGSGKSTLIKLLAGVTVPTEGEVRVYGRVASLLELGAGFHPLLTGRENVYLNGRILGMTPQDVDDVFGDILDFSGIGEFIDRPVDTYSSGMFVRLGFSVAVHANPDIFLVDEVLSVGDEEFQRKCRTRIGELKEQGRTIVFVSHDLGIVNTLCDRVVLLSKGRMISRGAPKDTIDFYMRQIGRERGVHAFGRDGFEVVMSHGRISLFSEREVSAPRGFEIVAETMGQWHASDAAEWEVTERGPAGCRARGRMLRQPVIHDWRLRLEEDALVWEIAVEAERDTPIDGVQAILNFPPAFERYLYGEEEDRFPAIEPGDLVHVDVVSPEMSLSECALMPPERAGLPAALVELSGAPSYTALKLANADYMTGSRIVRAHVMYPGSSHVLEQGRHELMTLRLRLDRTGERVEALKERTRTQRRLVSGQAAASFEQGRVEVSWKGEPLTAFTHWYSSMLAGHLWNDSHHFVWDAVEREGEALRATGRSRRLPLRQYWELAPAEGGFRLRIEAEVDEPVELQEYQVSVALPADRYDRWESDHESGPFPAFTPGEDAWKHANRDYAPGTRLAALSPDLPSVILKTTVPEPPFRMTAINTGHSHQARVLQALRTPGPQPLRFEPGRRYPYFEGRLIIDDSPPSREEDA